MKKTKAQASFKKCVQSHTAVTAEPELAFGPLPLLRCLYPANHVNYFSVKFKCLTQPFCLSKKHKYIFIFIYKNLSVILWPTRWIKGNKDQIERQEKKRNKEIKRRKRRGKPSDQGREGGPQSINPARHSTRRGRREQGRKASALTGGRPREGEEKRKKTDRNKVLSDHD